MVDFVKIRLRGRRYRHYRRSLRSHPLLAWRPAVYAIDRPPQGCIVVAEWSCLKFYGSESELLEIRGSFHKSHQQGSNWQDFTYWLFRFRLKRQDKARVASDTRKGLAMLTRMELAVSQRRRGTKLEESEFLERYAG